jgi:hypothetical protein
MTDQLIAPVIPPAADPVRGGPRRAGGGRPLPLADPLAVPLDAVYGMSRIDTSGRLTSQAISHVLNWRADDRLTLTAAVGVMVARRDRHGMVTVPARCFIAIPAALRHRCGLRPRDRVLLAAAPGHERAMHEGERVSAWKMESGWPGAAPEHAPISTPAGRRGYPGRVCAGSRGEHGEINNWPTPHIPGEWGVDRRSRAVRRWLWDGRVTWTVEGRPELPTVRGTT